MEPVCVYHDPQEFAAWPANAGLWQWGDEILVCYHVGKYREDPTGHSIDRTQPIRSQLSRSRDGGRTWAAEPSEAFDARLQQPAIALPGHGIDFSHPGFALKIGRGAVDIRNDRFVVSYDRGTTWEGPYALPPALGYCTARTDYLVNGERSCLLFLSERADEFPMDRAYAARTDDGGHTWSRVGYMTADPARSVMPATVRRQDRMLVSALRRRVAGPAETSAGDPRSPYDHVNWIEVRFSADEGRTWEFAAVAAETEGPAGDRNGNPPALGVLPDGRLVLAYGYRGEEPSMQGRCSADGGYSWSEPVLLREGAREADIGYPRLAVRPDGAVVVVYYFTTEARPEQHIEALIWRP